MRNQATVVWAIAAFCFLSGAAIWLPAPWDFVGGRFVFIHGLLGGLALLAIVVFTRQHPLLRLLGALIVAVSAFAFALTEQIAPFRGMVVAAHVGGGVLLLALVFRIVRGRVVRGVFVGACLTVFLAGLLAAMPLRRPEKPVSYDPFAPTDLRTATGGVLDISLMNDSGICAQCHPAIAEEWNASMHGGADIEDPFYMPTHDLMDQIYGAVEPGRYCSACHNPGLVASGLLVTPRSPQPERLLRDQLGVERRYRSEGISCLGCHGQVGNDLRGNGSFLLTHPPEAWYGLQGGILGVAESAAIRIRSDWHANAMRPPRLERPEFCASCHTQTVDERLNGFGFVKIRSEYEEWFAGYTGGKGTSEGALTCIECHMPFEATPDPSNRAGKHRSHRFVAGHTALPLVRGHHEQVERTAKFLRGENDPPELGGRWPAGPLIAIHGYGVPGPKATRLIVGLTNTKVGHAFPAGTITFADCWVEVVVTDNAGNVIFRDGVLDEQGRHEASFKLFGTLLDAHGKRLTMAQTFQAVGMGERRTIPPGYTEQHFYTIPYAKGFPWKVTARLHYRKMSPRFQAFSMPELEITLPVVTMNETVFEVAPVAQASSD